MYHVTIGRADPKSASALPRFFWLTLLSLRQARRAPGCVQSGVTARDGGFYSLTVWDSPAARDAYARSGAHLQAMRAARRLLTGFRAHSFTSDTVPAWDEALARWHAAETMAQLEGLPAE